MVDIATFLELRAAGYSVEDIRAYSGEQPTGQHEAREPKAEEQPAQDYQPKHAAQEQKAAHTLEPVPEEAFDNLVNALVKRLQGANLGAATIPTQERDANQILAEIINPPGRV